ncbi:MAG: N-6 DNA methylase [Candidatus Goldbacteria bacterium]|nr:N-6 DNA methylase [Candidatus Goldiibacteriota bacterium]
MDGETRRKIDNCRDILVGKIPDPKAQVEQITIALIYKFMDDMDKESEEIGGKPLFFTGKYSKYAWPKLMDSKIGGQERLNLYGESITSMNQNKNIPQLFRDIFKDAFLPYRDPETLNLFLKEISGFQYDHSENLGDAFEYLLSIMGAQGEAGQFRTPRHIIDFMVDVVQPKKNESVLDPACGTAGFLISSYNFILRQNMKKVKGDKLSPAEKEKIMKNFIGYDISPDMVRLSLVNMYLHGFQSPKIYEYDTLTNEDRWNDNFDVILANPPFMTPKGGIKPHKRFSIQANRSEVLFVDYIMEHLNLKGRAAVIVPEGIIFQSANAYKALRKKLVEENYLWAVASLPAGVFNPYAGVKTSILFMDREIAKKVKEILFVKIENDGFDLGAQRRPIDQNDLPEAAEVMKKYIVNVETGLAPVSKEVKKSAICSVVPKSKLAENGEYNLTGDRYRVVEVRGTQKWPMVKIEDVCEISTGARPKGGAVTHGVLSIGGEHLNSSGKIDISTPKYIPEDFYKRLKNGKIQIDDILVVKDGATTGKTAFYDQSYGFKDVAVNEHVFILRPIRNKIVPKYLFRIIQSVKGQDLLLSHKVGAAQGGINLSIKKIQIPLPPLEVQREIVAEIEGYQKIIDGARMVVDNWKPQINIDENYERKELGSICKLSYGYTNKNNSKGNIRYIRITDINEDGELRDDDSEFVVFNKEMKPYLLNKDDLLVARIGATYGKTLLFEKEYPAIYASFLIKLEFDNTKILNKYYWYFTRSDDYLRQKNKLVQGGAQPQFNANTIVKIQIPVPTIERQKEIIEKIESERKSIYSCRELIRIYEDKIRQAIDRGWGL